MAYIINCFKDTLADLLIVGCPLVILWRAQRDCWNPRIPRIDILLLVVSTSIAHCTLIAYRKSAFGIPLDATKPSVLPLLCAVEFIVSVAAASLWWLVRIIDEIGHTLPSPLEGMLGPR